jgi:hypothetical protein
MARCWMKPWKGARPVPEQNMRSGASALRGSLKMLLLRGGRRLVLLSPGLRVARQVPVTPAKVP